MIIELLQPVLVIVVGWLVRKALEALNVQLDPAAYNSIVAAIVVYLLALVGQEQAARLLG